MAYNNKYILSFDNDLNEFYEIFFDYLNYAGASTPIFGADDCLTIRSTSGDKNKMQSVIGTEALISVAVGPISVKGTFYQNTLLTINDLIAQHDNDIRVTVYYNRDYSTIIFQGFVVVEDNSQPFLDPPFTLSIRALDGLGLLSNVDMVDTTGALYSGIISIEDWLGNILMKTGQTLNLRVYFPFYPANNGALPPLQQVFLDATTWQKGPFITTTDPSIDVFASEADDALTALTAICRCFRAKLFQQDGCWNFVSLYSYANPNGYSYNESVATLIGVRYFMVNSATVVNKTYNVSIGHDQVIHPTHDDGVLSLTLGNKWVKLNYTYNQSFNKICNQGLIYGNADPSDNGTISSTFQNPSIKPAIIFNYLAYLAFCFTHLDGPGAFHPYPGIAPTAPAYIRDVQDINGYSVDRYLVLAKPTNILTYLRSSKFQIDQGDVLNFTFDWRTKENENVPSGLGTAAVAYILLYGIDGTFWAFGYAPQGTNKPSWTQMPDANFVIAGNTPTLNTPQFTDSAVNGYINCTTVLQSPSGSYYATAPISGDIEILFLYIPGQLGAPTEYWFKNISINVIPFLNGSFRPLKGDFNYSASNNNIKQTISEDVEISDSPKRYFQGALVDQNHAVIPPTWHRQNVIESFRFTQLMERVYFNNVNRILQEIEGTFRGLRYIDNNNISIVKHAGYINSYFFTDHPTPTKKFMLTSFEKNYATGEGRHVFVEVLADQNDLGFTVPDNYVFQYLFQ